MDSKKSQLEVIKGAFNHGKPFVIEKHKLQSQNISICCLAVRYAQWIFETLLFLASPTQGGDLA